METPLRPALTAVRDDPDGGVALSETRDGREAHLVGLRLHQLRQVVRHELSLVDGSVHGDLLLPPALQPHLHGRRGGSVGPSKITGNLQEFCTDDERAPRDSLGMMCAASVNHMLHTGELRLSRQGVRGKRRRCCWV